MGKYRETPHSLGDASYSFLQIHRDNNSNDHGHTNNNNKNNNIYYVMVHEVHTAMEHKAQEK